MEVKSFRQEIAPPEKEQDREARLIAVAEGVGEERERARILELVKGEFRRISPDHPARPILQYLLYAIRHGGHKGERVAY